MEPDTQAVTAKAKGRRAIFSAARIAGAAYLGLCLFLFFFQYLFIYRPSREMLATPAALRLPYEDVAFVSDGLTLRGWYVPAKPERAAVLFCHSNYGNISHFVDTVGIMHGLGLSVFIFDYRGFGRSAGRLSEAGTYADARAARRWLRQNKNPRRLIVWGRSLGGAMAARLAAEDPPDALVLESAFSSFPAVAADFFPYVPVRLIARFRYPTAEDAARVKCPTLVIHSRQDEVVAFRHGEIIYAALRCPKKIMVINGGHNDGYLENGRAYENGIAEFLRPVIDQ